MRYVPKVNLMFKLPTGARVSVWCRPAQSLQACARSAWPEMPAEVRILWRGVELAQNESIGQLGLVNDAELEVRV